MNLIRLKSVRLGAMRVSTRLALLVAISVAALLAVGLGGWIGIARVSESAARMQDERLPAANLLGDIRSGTASILQLSFEVLTRERQVNAQSRFAQTYNRLALQTTTLEKSIAAFEQIPKSPEEADAWVRFKESMTPWMARSKELAAIVKAMGENDDPDRQAQLFGQYKLPLSSWGHVQGGVEVNLAKLLKLNQEAAETARASDEATRSLAKRFIFAALGAASALLVVLAILFVRSITVPLERLRMTIVAIAGSKDFTARVAAEGRDELSQTARAFNDLVANVQTSLRTVLDNAEKIAGAAQLVSQASQRAASSSGEQSEAAAAMAAAIEQMTVSINHINDNMREAQKHVHAAGDSADTGMQAISRSRIEMDAIAATIADTSGAIDRLGAQTENIAAIVQVIKDVADQTNLLALNAAIEAARAGEQGRGFAVVADEVRKLAERTAHATTQISEVIGAIQDSGRETVSRMATVSGKVSVGKEMAHTAVERMGDINDSAKNVAVAINDVSSSLDEQSRTAQDIAQRVEAVATLSETNNQTANETAEVSRNLDTLAAGLRNAVSQFRV